MDEFDALDVLDALEIQIKKSPRIPFSNLRAVERTMLESLVALAREEVERSQQQPFPLFNRDEVLAQAESERRFLIENARHEADELLREERIKVFTRRRFDAIVEQGHEQARRIIKEANGYGAERFAEAEERLNKLSRYLREEVQTLKQGIKEVEKSHRQRKREEARKRRKK
jgi:uncharacterized protein YukE